MDNTTITALGIVARFVFSGPWESMLTRLIGGLVFCAFMSVCFDKLDAIADRIDVLEQDCGELQ